MTDLDALKEDLAAVRERGDLAAALTATTAEIYRLIEEVERLRGERAEIERLRACLKWYVDHDDTNEWEESNAFWLEGRRKATEVLERGEHRREGEK